MLLSVELWFFRSQIDLLVVEGRLSLLPDIYPALVHELVASSWWPLELCRAALAIKAAEVRGSRSTSLIRGAATQHMCPVECGALPRYLHAARAGIRLNDSMHAIHQMPTLGCPLEVPTLAPTPQLSGRPLTLPPGAPPLDQPFYSRFQERKYSLTPPKTSTEADIRQAALRRDEALRRNHSSRLSMFVSAPLAMATGEWAVGLEQCNSLAGYAAWP